MQQYMILINKLFLARIANFVDKLLTGKTKVSKAVIIKSPALPACTHILLGY